VIGTTRKEILGRGRTGAGRKPGRRVPVATLAEATETGRILLGALRAAYGWTDKTRLTRAEFLRLRDEWITGPGNEVRS